MAATKLDGAGAEKLKVISESLATLHTIYGHVERMAIDVQNKKGAGVFPQQIKRISGSLQGQLRGQFGPIADQVSHMILAASRGGSEALKVRTLREHVGQIRQALDIAATKVRDHHSVPIDSPSE